MMTPMIAALALMTMAPVPDGGADRAEILASVNAMLDALMVRDHEALGTLLEAEGTVVSVENSDPAAPRVRTTSFAKLRAPAAGERPVMKERLGAATVLQRGDIAHVWAPYRFSLGGKLHHCGINAFTLVRRDGRWRTAGIVYTDEPVDRCTELGAPASDD